MAGMTYNEPYVKILTSIVYYTAMDHNDEGWDRKWMVAVDDCQEDGMNSPFVCLKPSYWDWRGTKLPSDIPDAGPIAACYDQNGQRGSFSTPVQPTWKCPR